MRTERPDRSDAIDSVCHTEYQMRCAKCGIEEWREIDESHSCNENYYIAKAFWNWSRIDGQIICPDCCGLPYPLRLVRDHPDLPGTLVLVDHDNIAHQPWDRVRRCPMLTAFGLVMENAQRFERADVEAFLADMIAEARRQISIDQKREGRLDLSPS